MNNEIPFSQEEVKFFAKFNKNANKRQGLCETCKKTSGCTLPFHPMKAIMQCNNYEKVEKLTKQISEIEIDVIKKKKDLQKQSA